MRKYDKLFLIIGSILTLFPIYYDLGWWWLCYKYQELSLQDLGQKFDEEIFFNLVETNRTFGLSLLTLGLIASLLLLISFINSLEDKTIKLKTFKIIVFAINMFFTFWVLFGYL